MKFVENQINKTQDATQQIQDDERKKKFFKLPNIWSKLCFTISVSTISPHLHKHNRKIANVKTETVFFPLLREMIAYQVGWLKYLWCTTPVW